MISNKRNRYYFGGLMAVLALSSCQKDEPLWQLPAPGPEKVATVSMGENYENVIFFQLGTGATQVRNLNTWDLGFATGANEHHIIMNGGKEVQVYHTNETDFTKTYTATNSSPWVWDNPNGNPDSTAIGNWLDSATNQSSGKVYVIDLGKTENPRYKKVRFDSVTTDKYFITCANLDNTLMYNLEVSKDTRKNFTSVNLSLKQVVDFEPLNTSWGLVFIRYRHVYYDMDPITPYLVNGTIINTKFVTVNESDDLTFESIDVNQAKQLLLGTKADEIGFDWKTYNLDAGKYTVNQKKIFILKDKDGFYYKLRFIDFYNDKGAKGYPKFVYQRL